MTSKLEFKHLTSSEEILPTLSLLNQMYPGITSQEYGESIEEMTKDNGYKMLAIYSEGRLVAIAGFWILRMFYCGKYLQISNLVVDENCRGQNIGSQILDYFETYAKKQNCDHITLDSYIDNVKSHEFFKRQGFYVRGLHFMKKL